MSLRCLVILLVVLCAFRFCSPIPVKQKERLLLISFDGFRWDYLQRTETPYFDRITSNGVHAVKGLKNAFITKTFPNHYTLVTGQWEESHGIVANNMYDPFLNRSFSPGNKKENEEAAWFDQGGEPIWVTNQLQGKGSSGVVMWVGAGAPVKNVKPSKFMEFDKNVKNETKIDTLIQWFKDDPDMNLGLLYFDQPDGFGHIFGPESEQVTAMIGGLDKLVGYLLKKLEQENLLKETNIIITSDHGFTSTPKSKSIDLSGVVDFSTFTLEGSTPIAGIWPHPGFHDAILHNLTAFAKKVGHFKVFQKEDIPPHFHYSLNRRIPPIIAVADDHYSFSAGGQWTQAGNHGYDNRLQDMHPFFVAMGPSFKVGVSVETFDSVDVYPLMCHILGLAPAPNNGSMEIVRALLSGGNNTTTPKNHVLSFFKKHRVEAAIVACVVIVVLSLAVAFVVQNWSRWQRNHDELGVHKDSSDGVATPVLRSPTAMSSVPLLHDQDL